MTPWTQLDDVYQLRQLEENHAGELFALTDQHRHYLREWLGWVDGTVLIEDTRAYLRRMQEEFSEGKAIYVGIWERDSLVGTALLGGIDPVNRSAEIGYWLSPLAQGKGVMTRTCKALTGYAFRDLGLNRVEIRCATGNVRSRAIPERLGFEQEGTRREAEWLYDRFVDHVIYGKLARDWSD